MRNCDLRNPNGLQPGPGRLRLTNGDGSGVVSTLIRSIIRTAVQTDITFGIGGSKIYRITPTTVASDASFPHTIDGSNPDGEDIKPYHGGIIYTFNDSLRGYCGKLTLPSTFDDDWMYTALTGTFALNTGYPHPIEIGGDDLVYIGDKDRVVSYDPVADTAQSAVNLPDDVVIQDVKWKNKKLYITVNQPNLTGTNQTQQGVYIWNTVDDSWEDDVHKIARGGGMFVKDGVLYISFEDISSDGIGRLGYFDGYTIKELAKYDGSLAAYYQITEQDGFIMLAAAKGNETLIFAFGGGEEGRIFQLAKGHHPTIGGISCPFGKLMTASAQGTTAFNISKEEGFDPDCNWKGILYPVAMEGRKGLVRQVRADFSPLAVGTGLSMALRDNNGTEVWRGTISYTLYGNITKKIFHCARKSENARVEIDYSNFRATTTVVFLRDIDITGNNII
jgi:hypothetical protein